ncbi:hypothetical protein [Maricaulis parjimensis]|uniref:hypothetical protein n=1 Tax=Maricaulis parjimensis TaxID=144023 RepID=UPI00193A391E|nr:hypothetical protein [Maricaulis parjimensis]
MRFLVSLFALAVAATPAGLAQDTPVLPANQTWTVRLGSDACELRLSEVMDQSDGRWIGAGDYDCGGGGVEMVSWGIELIDGRPDVTLTGDADIFYGEGCEEGWPDWAVGQRENTVCWLSRDVGIGMTVSVERTQ